MSLFQLDNFVQYLQPAVVNDQIFPNVAMGFGDTVPAMREHTIKVSFLLICEKPISVRGGGGCSLPPPSHC
jgi:SCY1-like protein 1